MKKDKGKGFTLVELLAVIVILAIILVIAIPQIKSVIKAARLSAIKDSAILIAEQADKDFIAQQVLNKDYSETSIPCSDVAKLNDDYDNCSITYNNGIATVALKGKDGGKFSGITCTGTKDNMCCTTEEENECSSSGGSSSGVSTQTAAEVISVKYNDGTNSEGLILVNTNEYRYSGAIVKNYVNFNNETWRIVGIFNGRVKLMRDAVLSTNGPWYSTYSYSNAWEGSDIELGLNGNYLTSTGYLGSSLSSTAQTLIDDAVWYVTPITYNQDTASAYAAERPSSNAVTYEGKVGLINPSDYGYASSSCYNDSTKLLYSSTQANSYHSDTCKNANWMYENMSSTYWWTIAPSSVDSTRALNVFTTGYVHSRSVNYALGVRPSVYLKSGVKLASTSGDGSSASNAYVFEI